MQAKPNIDISQAHWAIVSRILTDYLSGYEVWAFGSRAKHQAKPFSDLDLVVITTEPLSLTKLALANEAFEESDLPWKVDLLDWAATSSSFQQVIERDKVVIRQGAGVFDK